MHFYSLSKCYSQVQVYGILTIDYNLIVGAIKGNTHSVISKDKCTCKFFSNHYFPWAMTIFKLHTTKVRKKINSKCIRGKFRSMIFITVNYVWRYLDRYSHIIIIMHIIVRLFASIPRVIHPHFLWLGTHLVSSSYKTYIDSYNNISQQDHPFFFMLISNRYCCIKSNRNCCIKSNRHCCIKSRNTTINSYLPTLQCLRQKPPSYGKYHQNHYKYEQGHENDLPPSHSCLKIQKI